MKFAHNEILKQLREDSDQKQETIAKLLHVSQSYYSKQERGEKPFKIEQIKLLCEYYHVSADYVLDLPPDLKWPRLPIQPKEGKQQCHTIKKKL